MKPTPIKHHFSFVELLMLVSIVAIITSLVIIAMNPIAKFSGARNAERWNHANVLVNALARYAQDHQGVLPDSVGTSSREICRSGVVEECAGPEFVLLAFLVPEYIPQLPLDPLGEIGIGSGYALSRSSEGKITVTAIRAEEGDSIIVSR